MSDDRPEPQVPGYAPPPPTQYPPPYPPYPPAGQQQPGPAYGYPTYPEGYPQGYPQAYPYYAPPGYNAYNTSPAYGRPGTVIGAAVLAYVVAGLLILAGVILFSGASTINDIGDSFGADTSSATTELVLDGLLDLIVAGLLIAGGVNLSMRRPSGRTLLYVGVVIVALDAIYWVGRVGGGAGVVIFWAGIFVIPAIIAGCLALGTTITTWLAANRGR